MRSLSIFASLALAGLADRVAAGRCAPPSQTTTAPATTTSHITVVTNVVIGGNFAAPDPNYRNDIYGFESEGNCRQVQGEGYQGDNSQETGCVLMDSDPVENTGTGSKRQTSPDYDAVIEQLLNSLDVASLYTVRFFYAVIENDVGGTCRIDAYYGDSIFASTDYFPMTSDTGSNYQWREFVQQIPIETASGWLKFALSCAEDGHAKVYIDQIFMSNQVDPQDVDSVSVSYISEVAGPTTSASSTATSTTASVPTTTTDYCLQGVASGSCEAVTPQGGNAICAVVGNIIGEPYWGSSSSNGPVQDSPEVCAWLCQTQSNCVAFGFSAAETQCYFLSLKLSSGYLTPNANSDTAWWDMGCMGCCVAGAQKRAMAEAQLGFLPNTLGTAIRPTWTTAA